MDIGKKFQYESVFREQPLRLNNLFVYQIGEIRCEPGYEVGLHDQWCLEITCVIGGEGNCYHNGNPVPFVPNDIIITPNNVTHKIIASDKSELRFAYLGFLFADSQSNTINELSDFYHAAPHPVCHDKTNLYEILLKCISEFSGQKSYNDTMIETYLIQFLISVYRNMACQKQRLLQDGQKLDFKADYSSEMVYKTIRYVEQNIFSGLQISEISSKLGYHPCYLSPRFKEQMGMTLQDYISRKKIQKSIEMMTKQNFSVSQASEKLGYSNVQAFSRAFKRNTNVSPSAYLKEL